MDYKFAGDFTKAPLGAFTEANKKKVWNDPAMGGWYDADKTGKYFEMVDDSRFPGGRACRMTYLKGSYGMNDQFYQVRYKSPQTICNLEFLWLFENNFSFYSPVAGGDGGGGKIGPCINWGEVGGDNAKRGTRCMWWWNSHGSKKDNECLNPIIQDQRSGNQLVQPVVYTKKIVLDQIYKFRIQMKGGPDGFVKHWITYPGDAQETLLSDVKGKNLMATATDDVLYDFAFFSGGAVPAYSPEWDSYARHGGVRYWSGEAYWASGDVPVPPDTGNGGGGGTDGGGGTTPTPPAGATSRYSLAVGETKIFRARFWDASASPPKEMPAGAAVKWSLEPNLVTWGQEMSPNWSAIQVKGKTAGGPCVLIATDPSNNLSTTPINVDVTETPRIPGANEGICSVEPLGMSAGAGGRAADSDFKDEPPQ
jgi:hypothetical protein